MMKQLLPEPQNDGLLTPEVKPHSRDKHHYLRRYLDAFSTAMFDKWSHRCYVDLFAGAGIENVLGHGLDWGSPLIAAQMPKQFTQLLVNDLDVEKATALEARLQSYAQPCAPLVLSEDANTAVDKFVEQIPQRGSLTLAFLDPYGLHLNFDAVRKLSSRRADLIIYFPDHLDALRNWDSYYMNQNQSNLDKFLGTGIWRESLSESNSTRHPEILRGLYEAQLKTLGYKWFDYKRIYTQHNRPIYRLIFATGHKKGLDIWKNISGKGPDGQSSFDWGC